MSTKPFLKRMIRWLIAWIVYYSGFLKLWPRMYDDGNPIVLVYHRVLDTTNGSGEFSLPGVIVSIDSFRKQIKYLSKNYRTVSLEQLVTMVKKGAKLQNLAVVTFDDGWKDNYTNAYPVLLQYGVPATVFLVTDYIGTTRWFWPEKITYLLMKTRNVRIRVSESVGKLLNTDSKHLPVALILKNIDVLIERLKYLSSGRRGAIIRHLEEQIDEPLSELESKEALLGWNEVKEMANNGISFGSHTQTHPIVTREPIQTVRKEIVNSKMEIEKHLKRSCTAFAYPNGDWNESVRKVVVESDYDCACSLSRTRLSSGIDLYSLRRRVVHEGFAAGAGGKFSQCVFAAQLAGFFDRLTSMTCTR